jgi:Domain of unknown function (DUF3854)
VNPHLDFLLSSIYDGLLHPRHRDDLRKSGLSDETITLQKIRTIPPSQIDQVLGFETPKAVTSAYLIPFRDPAGGFMDHPRVRVFLPDPAKTKKSKTSGTIKYLQRRHSCPRLFFTVLTLDAVLHSTDPLWVVEGEKKAMCVARLGLPSVGFCGIEGWHAARSSALLEDFAAIPLSGRIVEIVTDGDVHTNPNVARGARRFADALRAVGAQPRLVRLPGAA